MATYDLTAAGGTTGHPSNGRTPYLVENTIDVSAINGDSGAAQNDVLRALDIPAETLIMEAGIEVITALSSSVTLDLGITGGDVDRYVDGDTNATGFSAPTATARTIVASSVCLQYFAMYQVLTKLTEIQTLSTTLLCNLFNFKGGYMSPLIYTPYNI